MQFNESTIKKLIAKKMAKEFKIGVLKGSERRNLPKNKVKLFAGVKARAISTKPASISNAEVLASQPVNILEKSFKNSKKEFNASLNNLLVNYIETSKDTDLRRVTNGLQSIPRTYITKGKIGFKENGGVRGLDTAQLYKSITAKEVESAR